MYTIPEYENEKYDAYKSIYDQAKANVALGQASLVQARKAVDAAKATLNHARLLYGYFTGERCGH